MAPLARPPPLASGGGDTARGEGKPPSRLGPAVNKRDFLPTADRLAVAEAFALAGHDLLLTVEAIYAGGVLKPTRPLPLKEQVLVTVSRPANVADPTYGMIGWSGDEATFDRLLRGPETDRLEQP